MRFTVLAAGAFLAFAVPAYSQEAPLDTYGGAGEVLNETVPDQGGPGGAVDEELSRGEGAGDVRGETVGGGGGATTDAGRSGGGALPFTGADVTLMLFGGLALLAVGIAVRRVSRSPA